MRLDAAADEVESASCARRSVLEIWVCAMRERMEEMAGVDSKVKGAFRFGFRTKFGVWERSAVVDGEDEDNEGAGGIVD